jgi:hypothetical protein
MLKNKKYIETKLMIIKKLPYSSSPRDFVNIIDLQIPKIAIKK